jgi:hypothetical protein
MTDNKIATSEIPEFDEQWFKNVYEVGLKKCNQFVILN